MFNLILPLRPLPHPTPSFANPDTGPPNQFHLPSSYTFGIVILHPPKSNITNIIKYKFFTSSQPISVALSSFIYLIDPPSTSTPPFLSIHYLSSTFCVCINATWVSNEINFHLNLFLCCPLYWNQILPYDNPPPPHTIYTHGFFLHPWFRTPLAPADCHMVQWGILTGELKLIQEYNST